MKTLLLILCITCFGLLSCKQQDTGSTSTTSTTESLSLSDIELPPIADHPAAVDSALPFTIQFIEKSYGSLPPLPRLQSYVSAFRADGKLLLVCGGRRQGLHTFKEAPHHNFIADSSNNYMYVINLESGQFWSFDANQLSPELAAPLQSTNQQAYHDATSDRMYIVGGYGWTADKKNMVTFNTLITFKVADIIQAIVQGASPSTMESLIRVSQDDRWAVTGGELIIMDDIFYLVFGQKFMGEYRAFGGGDFTQEYTEEVRMFTLDTATLKIRVYSNNTNTSPDRPFHRRDGNIIEDVDPQTGSPRITAYGGVFKPGIIGPYTYPVYITGTAQPVVDNTVNQKFSQYECPVISVYDSSGTNPAVYHTFFGGIGHYYYFQTPGQKDTFEYATGQGRNDGFPFVADITTFIQRADGTFDEFIHTSPIVNNRLLGTSLRFIPLPYTLTKNYSFPNRVFRLDKLQLNQTVLLGYIYGGIEANNPLPYIPNTGTSVSNSVFQVVLTRTPSPAIPASEAHESKINDFKLR